MYKSMVQKLSANGDGTGDFDAILDFATTPTTYYLQPATNQEILVRRLIVFIEDTKVWADNYGNLAALTNGVDLRVQNDTRTLLDLTAGLKISSNAMWRCLCHDGTESNFGVGNEFFVARYSFDRFSTGLYLRGINNDRLEALFSDDLTGLVAHMFIAEGEFVNEYW